MDFNYILGVDQSKSTFNFCLMDTSVKVLWEGQRDNTTQAVTAFIEELCEHLAQYSLAGLLLCMEHTGVYTKPLAEGWLKYSGRLTLVAGNKINKSLDGVHRQQAKDDAIDARRIAEYALRFTDKLQLWVPQSLTLKKISSLQRERNRLVKVKTLLEVPLKEGKQFDSDEIYEESQRASSAVIQATKEAIEEVERQLRELIHEDKQLRELFELITSVPGVGKVTATEVIIATEGFTKFTPDQAKQFAKNCGVVPLPYSSGSSVRRRSRTSKKANTRMRTLLTMCARASLSSSGELRNYYDRKRAEGKEYLVVINALKNKLILRIFAAVRNNTPYQPVLEIA